MGEKMQPAAGSVAGVKLALVRLDADLRPGRSFGPTT